MELLDVIQKICQTNYKAMSPTELVIGTVVSASPLQISINTGMAPLNESVLYLTAAVIPKTLSSLTHTHTAQGLEHSHTIKNSATETEPALDGEYESGEALQTVVCTENGVALENGDAITLNRGLEAGDKVLLLRVRQGQKFVVLSRVYEGGSSWRHYPPAAKSPGIL